MAAGSRLSPGKAVRSRIWRPAGALTLALLLPISATGQSADADRGLQVQIQGGFQAHATVGRWTPVLVTVDNRGRDQELELVVETEQGQRFADQLHRYRLVLPIVVPGNGRVRRQVIMPVSGPGQEFRAILREPRADSERGATGAEQVLASAATSFGRRARIGPVIVALDSRSNLDLLTERSGEFNTAARLVTYPPTELLPENWLGYSGVQAIILGDRDAGLLNASQWQAIEDWVRLGGVLYVFADIRAYPRAASELDSRFAPGQETVGAGSVLRLSVPAAAVRSDPVLAQSIFAGLPADSPEAARLPVRVNRSAATSTELVTPLRAVRSPYPPILLPLAYSVAWLALAGGLLLVRRARVVFPVLSLAVAILATLVLQSRAYPAAMASILAEVEYSDGSGRPALETWDYLIVVRGPEEAEVLLPADTIPAPLFRDVEAELRPAGVVMGVQPMTWVPENRSGSRLVVPSVSSSLSAEGIRITNTGPGRLLGGLYLREGRPPSGVPELGSGQSTVLSGELPAPDWPDTIRSVAEVIAAGRPRPLLLGLRESSETSADARDSATEQIRYRLVLHQLPLPQGGGTP